MDSLTFTPGQARLLSLSPIAPWAVLFEDEGPGGYFYVCDRSLGDGEAGMIDSMLIYNAASLSDRDRERLASVQWSRDGLRAVLYLDGTPQALANFETRESFCRMDFPNFIDMHDARWRSSSHAWNETALKSFEDSIYES